MSKKNFVILGTCLYSSVFVALWLIYSLFRFDGFYSPLYVYGLSDSFKYYQEHIGLQLIENGIEYDMNTMHDEPELKVYKDIEHGFEFKYSNDLKVSVHKFSKDVGEELEFKNKGLNKKCTVGIRYKGRGVGVNWLPKNRMILETRITKGDEILYFYGTNGQIAYINNMTKPRKVIKDRYVNFSTLFINQSDNKFVRVNISGNDCLNFTRRTIATFQFL